MDLAHLTNNKGARHRTKRLGCGIGSGHGKTSCRGGKGQTARTGSSIRPGFEGGQMPLYRRLPKRGFNSWTPDELIPVSVGDLNVFSNGDIVTPATLKARGLVKKFEGGIKILGDGELTKKLTVLVNAFSNSAIERIKAAAGQCRVIKKADALKDFDGVAALDVKASIEAKPYVRTPKPPRKSKASKGGAKAAVVAAVAVAAPAKPPKGAA